MHVLTAIVLAFALSQATRPAPPSLDGARETAAELLALNAKAALRSERGAALRGGELKEISTDSFGPLDEAPNLVVPNGDGYAVARTSRRRDDGSKVDVYLYLAFEDAWRVTAMRALALPRFFLDLRDNLRARSTLTDEERLELANSDLVLASDAELAAWFSAHEADMRRLATLAAKKSGRAATADRARMEAILRRLAVTSVGSEGGAVRVLVGGIMDNSVGFLYSPGAPPQEITTYEYIWVERIAPGWYLYRTT
jgi:hypothetical protein